jgi:hypothetical protein
MHPTGERFDRRAASPSPVSLHSPHETRKLPGMEKEPRLKRRGLDSETLTALQTAGPENLTTTTSAHAAEEAMNLLILAVVRLERALQRVHPPTFRQGKHTRNYTGVSRGRQAYDARAPGIARRSLLLDNFHPHSPGLWGYRVLSTFRATFARLSSNNAVHISTDRLSSMTARLGIPTHRFSPLQQEVIQTTP